MWIFETFWARIIDMISYEIMFWTWREGELCITVNGQSLRQLGVEVVHGFM